jgi:putative tricarboxylic transport membrane protein
MSDRIFAGIWLLLCVGGMFVAWQIHSEYSYEPVGPRPFPMGIVGLMLLCSVALLLRHPDTVEWPPRRSATPAGDGGCAADVRVGL